MFAQLGSAALTEASSCAKNMTPPDTSLMGSNGLFGRSRAKPYFLPPGHGAEHRRLKNLNVSVF